LCCKPHLILINGWIGQGFIGFTVAGLETDSQPNKTDQPQDNLHTLHKLILADRCKHLIYFFSLINMPA
jgi:hypothetical protein